MDQQHAYVKKAISASDSSLDYYYYAYWDIYNSRDANTCQLIRW